MLGDWKRDCTFSTWVDSALGGSQADASFFSAPLSLPASEPSTATMISQKTRTAHLVRRPLEMPTIARVARLMVIPQGSFSERSAHAELSGMAGRKSRHISCCGHRNTAGAPGQWGRYQMTR